MATKQELEKLKAVLRASAAQEASVLESEFERKGLGFISPPPELQTRTNIGGAKYRGRVQGEWDWYSNLTKVEKNRLRRNWTSPGGMQPDQFGINDSITGQFRSVNEGVEEFLDLTRRIDVLKTYANTGRLPKNMDAYGGLDLDKIFSGVFNEIESELRVSVSMSELLDDPLTYLSKLYNEIEIDDRLAGQFSTGAYEARAADDVIEIIGNYRTGKRVVLTYPLDTHEMNVANGLIEIFKKELPAPEKPVVAKISSEPEYVRVVGRSFGRGTPIGDAKDIAMRENADKAVSAQVTIGKPAGNVSTTVGKRGNKKIYGPRLMSEIPDRSALRTNRKPFTRRNSKKVFYPKSSSETTY